MMRCRRCNQVVAAFSVACICGEIVISAVKEVRLYVNPDLHAHQEQMAPPQPKPITVAAISTSASTSNVGGSYVPIFGPPGSTWLDASVVTLTQSST
jgi:hypothetical protein